MTFSSIRVVHVEEAARCHRCRVVVILFGPGTRPGSYVEHDRDDMGHTAADLSVPSHCFPHHYTDENDRSNGSLIVIQTVTGRAGQKREKESQTRIHGGACRVPIVLQRPRTRPRRFPRAYP